MTHTAERASGDPFPCGLETFQISRCRPFGHRSIFAVRHVTVRLRRATLLLRRLRYRCIGVQDRFPAVRHAPHIMKRITKTAYRAHRDFYASRTCARICMNVNFSLSDSVCIPMVSLLGRSHGSLSRARVMSDRLNLAGHVQVRWSARPWIRYRGKESRFLLTKCDRFTLSSLYRHFIH